METGSAGGSGWERKAPWGGIGYVVLYIAAIAMFGDFPESGDAAGDFAAYYADDRTTYIAASLLVLAAFGLFLWFAIGLASRLRASGLQGAAIALAATTATYVAVSLTSLGMTLGLVAAEASAEVDPTFLKGVEAMSDGIWLVAWLPLALVILAYGTSAPRAGLAPTWFQPVSIVSAAILLAGTTTWAEDGIWSPFGGFVVLIAAALLLWTLTASVLALRAPRPR